MACKQDYLSQWDLLLNFTINTLVAQLISSFHKSQTAVSLAIST